MKYAAVLRLVLLACLVSAGAVAAWLLRDQLEPVFQWVRGLGLWGLVLLAVAYLPAALVAFPPAWMLTIAAGGFYDVFSATIAVSVGSTLAATTAFLLGRTLARGWIEARMARRPLFRALDAAVAEGGFKIVLLARLSPLLPFVLLNYAFGLTRIKLRDYVLASWTGMAPGTLLYVCIGATLRGAAEAVSGKAPDTGTAGKVLWWVGLAASLVVALLVTWQARRMLRQALKLAQERGRAATPTER